MTAHEPDFDSAFFRSALGRFATGVTIVMTDEGEAHSPVGLTISSFNSVSLEPPLISWTLSRKSASLQKFLNTRHYVVHVLSAPQLHLAKRFASGPQSQRFEGVSLTRTPGGTAMLDTPDCAAWFECFNLCHHEAGDHILFIGQVERCQRSFLPPLVYHAGDFDLTPAHEPLADS